MNELDTKNISGLFIRSQTKNLLHSIIYNYNNFDPIPIFKLTKFVKTNADYIVEKFNKEINETDFVFYYYSYELNHDFELTVFVKNTNREALVGGASKIHIVAVLTNALFLKIVIDLWNKENLTNQFKQQLKVYYDDRIICENEIKIISKFKEKHQIELITHDYS